MFLLLVLRDFYLLFKQYFSWSNIKSRQASIESIIDLVNQPAKLRLKETSNLKFKFNKFIELKNISFKYPGKIKKLLVI